MIARVRRWVSARVRAFIFGALARTFIDEETKFVSFLGIVSFWGENLGKGCCVLSGDFVQKAIHRGETFWPVNL